MRRGAHTRGRRSSPRLRRLTCGVVALGLVLVGGGPLRRDGGLRHAEAAGKKALDEYFKGAVVGLEGKTVTLRYDFREKDQIKDFEDQKPFNLSTRKGQKMGWFDEKLEVVGNAAARHRAEWEGDLEVEATFVADTDKDIGLFMSPVTGENDFVIFTLTETNFHKWDKSPGMLNSIIKFGDQWREGDATADFTGFRYIDRKTPKEKLAPGQQIRVTAALQKGKLLMTGPDFSLKGKDMGKKKLKRVFVGFYTIKGRMLLDNIVIKGQLAPDWLRRRKVELRTTKPIGAASSDGLDAATQAMMADHAKGKSKATRGLVRKLQDESLSEDAQSAICEALAKGPKKAVRYAQDLLYHEREAVRAHGIRIIKGLLGKDYGYKAKHSEKKRSAAIRRMNEDLKKNPDLLKD